MSCGGKTEYISVTPKFCNQCGVAFAGTTQTAKTKLVQTKPFQRIEVEEDDDEDNKDASFVPSISQLDVEIEAPRESKILLGELAKQKKTGFVRMDKSTKSSSEVIEELQREAGYKVGKDRNVILIQDNSPE